MNQKDCLFQKLTPYSEVELAVYEDAFDFVFANDDVKNIAISGSYGSGKSSLLESYKNKDKDKKFLHISLAHFQQHTDTSSHNEEKIKEFTLEGKIINQLIHQIPSEDIPQTGFKIKQQISKKSLWGITGIIMLFILSILHLSFFQKWNMHISSLPEDPLGLRLALLWLTSHYSSLASFAICLLISIYVLYHLVKVQKYNGIFKRINLQGNEIELFEKGEDSYFDKYLTEVLYLFGHTHVDVIVFEDIDRFDNSQIFERLREINTLVNIQLMKKKNTPLRFFYLLRDDIFISKDRTKFFDFIIPVIPVVDSSNSFDQILTLLKKAGDSNQLDKAFLYDLSLYLDDMRMIKNICNEYNIYLEKLNIIELNCNKMLAIITYKNLFPRDFCDLQLNKGMVFNLFDQKDKLFKGELSTGKKLKDLITKDNIDSTFKTISYTNEIGEKNNFNEIKRSEYFALLKYLLRNGYIDESYSDYMTYFYENSLSKQDKLFLRSITDEYAKSYSHPLSHHDGNGQLP